MSGVATAGMHEVPGRGRLMERSDAGAVCASMDGGDAGIVGNDPSATAIGESELRLKPLPGFLPHSLPEPNKVEAVMAGIFATPSTGLVGPGAPRERAL